MLQKPFLYLIEIFKSVPQHTKHIFMDSRLITQQITVHCRIQIVSCFFLCSMISDERWFFVLLILVALLTITVGILLSRRHFCKFCGVPPLYKSKIWKLWRVPTENGVSRTHLDELTGSLLLFILSFHYNNNQEF